MKKKNSRFCAAFLAALMAAAFICTNAGTAWAASELPEPSEKFYVADYTNILDDDVENDIVWNSSFFEENYDVQFVLATVESFGNSTPEAYAKALYEAWIPTENGALIVVCPNDAGYYVEPGENLRDYIPDEYLLEVANPITFLMDQKEYLQAAYCLYFFYVFAVLHDLDLNAYHELCGQLPEGNVFEPALTILDANGGAGDLNGDDVVDLSETEEGARRTSVPFGVILIFIIGIALMIFIKASNKKNNESPPDDDMPFAPPAEQDDPFAPPVNTLSPYTPPDSPAPPPAAWPAPQQNRPVSPQKEQKYQELTSVLHAAAQQKSVEPGADVPAEFPAPSAPSPALPSFDDYAGAFSTKGSGDSPWASFSSFDRADKEEKSDGTPRET